MISVILYNIRSVQNVGSIFRTADGAGARKIYLCGITPAPVDEFGRSRSQFVKVSLGAENTIEWIKPNLETPFPNGSKTEEECVKETLQLIKKLKQEGYKILSVEKSEKDILYNA